ncbi:M14 family metallopeptidase [Lysobacter sp. LF1]|uniref:M14 family metallopeptidase n=1 Tax=Lysobacter stagni TaxID=3045172 RepID=A0ABT6XF52_9GAMM|nr:M14 family metallopeptidase [Lysobacter sp. LF1]MDI9238684.1 M14 family metallopeptidase [Lysobacter sp. LF1]
MTQPPPLLTRAEATQYAETSRHTDVMAFVKGLVDLGDPRLHVGDFGKTPEGRELPLLVLSGSGVRTPQEARASDKPVVLVLCGIHAGEVEGKEAGLMYVRDLLHGAHGDVLSHVTLLLVPLFNADGNDRIDPGNRRLDIAHFTGQLGPDSGVGTRVNAAGINLNRDYMRQDAPEMRLLQTRVMHLWNPHLTIDCHATNGSIHRYALTYDIPHTALSGRSEPVEYMREQLLPAVSGAVKANDGFDTFWYGNFLRDEGGHGAGWITYTHHPRFGGNYRGLTNRLDLLLETYAYIDFYDRVHTTYAFLRETIAYAAAHAQEIVELLAGCEMPPDEIAVRYRLAAFADRDVDILTRDPYTLEGEPVSARVPYIGDFVGEHFVQRPLAYAVPGDIADRLEGHGLVVERPPVAPMLHAEIAIVTAQGSQAGRDVLEADASPWLETEVTRDKRLLPEGWALVRTEQQRGAVAVYLCEAGSDDGLLACGWIAPTPVGDEFPAWRVQAIDHPG